MRLELKQIQGPGRKGATPWFFERGRRTLGRSGDCDWQVLDTARTVSKLHCTIVRDRDGFLLQDESANGTRVDGVLVLEGEAARLGNDARLELGDFVFAVMVSGEKDREMEDPASNLPLSDDSLTISAILADVSPGGQSATGILAGHVAEDLLAKSASRMAEPAVTGRKAAAPPVSRNVEIGWSGPPSTAGIEAVLPTDWNEDFDYGNRLEHSSATYVSVPMARSSRAEADATYAPMQAPAAEPEEAEAEAFVPPAATRALDLLPRLESLLRQCEEAAGEAFAAFEINDPVVPDLADSFGGSREEALLRRLEALAQRQRLLGAALDALVRDASHTLEPRIIEAHVDTESRGLPWLKHRNYWQVYRQNFSEDGKDLPIRHYFRKVILQALDMSEREKVVRSE